MALLKLCRCGKPISLELVRCDQCQTKQKERHKLYDKNIRDKKAAAFYNSKEWKLVRKLVLSRDFGLCQRCYERDDITLADMVDHIIPIKVDWSRRLDTNNCQSLCNQCHPKKTAEDKKKYN